MRKFESKSGQIVTEYLMILIFVFFVLALSKLKVDASGSIAISESGDAKTIMQLLSDAFTLWMQDILLILSLPS